MLFAWRQAMAAGAATGLHAQEPLVSASEVKQLRLRVGAGAHARAQDSGSRDLKEAVELTTLG